jgi:hypothetical protein
MSAGVSCELWLRGARVADTIGDYQAAAPTALGGLSLTWGRSTNLEQPATATCTFTIADTDGDADFLGDLHVGRTVEIYAAGAITTGDPSEIAVDGGFETTAPAGRAYTQRGTLATTTTAAEGAQAYQLTVTGASADVWLPPAPFNDADFTAWDALPNVTPGDDWTASLQTQLGPGQHASLSVATYATPATGPGIGVGDGASAAEDAAGAWQTVSVDWTAPDGVGYAWGGAWLHVSLGTWDQASGTWDYAPGAWSDWATTLLDDLQIFAPQRAQRRVLVFTGRLTDLHATYPGVMQVAATAADWTADLANINVGDAPWPAQSMSARVATIRGLSDLAFTTDIDPHPGALQVSWVDVDNQPVAGLLSDLATSTDAVLWPAFHATRGFYLWFEDPDLRAALAQLTLDTGTGMVILTGLRPAATAALSACEIDRDPVTFTQDVADVLTRIDLDWQQQTLDDTGAPAPTTQTVQIIDSAAEAEPDGYGVRRLSYSTQLTSVTDATATANRVLARADRLGWRASGIHWDTRLPEDFGDGYRNILLDLLDGTARLGAAITLTDMPDWAPTGGQEFLSVFLEGGTYSYASGRWALDMNVTPGGGAGYAVLWLDLDPGWSWAQFDPGIRWLDCWGVVATQSSPRWSWLDPAQTWDATTGVWDDYWGPMP